DKTDDAVAATADVKITEWRNAVGQRRPMHAVVTERGSAAIARSDPVTASGQSFGKCCERGLRTAERPSLRGGPVEHNTVIGHPHPSHDLPLREDRAGP